VVLAGGKGEGGGQHGLGRIEDGLGAAIEDEVAVGGAQEQIGAAIAIIVAAGQIGAVAASEVALDLDQGGALEVGTGPWVSSRPKSWAEAAEQRVSRRRMKAGMVAAPSLKRSGRDVKSGANGEPEGARRRPKGGRARRVWARERKRLTRRLAICIVTALCGGVCGSSVAVRGVKIFGTRA